MVVVVCVCAGGGGGGGRGAEVVKLQLVTVQRNFFATECEFQMLSQAASTEDRYLCCATLCVRACVRACVCEFVLIRQPMGSQWRKARRGEI